MNSDEVINIMDTPVKILIDGKIIIATGNELKECLEKVPLLRLLKERKDRGVIE